nr:hypothetical protein GCM10020063_006560 [Dactylosporangium thailandense]
MAAARPAPRPPVLRVAAPARTRGRFPAADVNARAFGLDLMLGTRTGLIFEIFSDAYYAEWRFVFWLPEDERRLPVFDLERPVEPGLV